MKAIVMREVGEPSVLRIEEVPIPKIGPTEVLVKVAACGVSFHDIVERNGTFRRDVKLPLTPGYEIAGTVEVVGAQVTTLTVGDRVCCKPLHSCGMCKLCRTGMETGCRKRVAVHGGYAEYVALPEEVLVTVPDEVDLDAACMLGAAAGVALHAVRDVTRVTIGESVLITGASGGLGLPTIDLVRGLGARAIALTRSSDKRQRLLDHGAHDVVVAAEGQNFSREVMELTDGEGVDVVIDNVGSRTFDSAFKCLAVRGRYAFVGQLFGEDIAINPARIFFKRAQLLGVGSVRRDQLQDAARLAAAGLIRPVVGVTMPLAGAAEAHALVERGGAFGRVVLKP